MKTEPALAITAVNGSRAGTTFPLRDVSFVGSQSSCEIWLEDPGIVALHARIDKRGSACTLTDLSDQSDIRINGRPIKSRRLAVGDQITIANTRLTVVDAAGEGRPVSSEPDSEIVIVTTEAMPEETGATAYTEPPVPMESPEPPVLPAEVETPDEATVPVAAAHPVAAIPSKAATGKRKRRVILLVAVLAAMCVIVGVPAYLFHGQRQEMEAQYRAAVDYALAHPEDPRGTIDRYEAARTRVGGIRPDLYALLSDKIDELQKQMTAQEDEYSTLLATLDDRTKALVRTNAYAAALTLYAAVDPKFRNRIADARKDTIAELTRNASAQKEARDRREALDKALQEQLQTKAAQLEFQKVCSNVVEAVVQGQTDEATALLQGIAADRRFAFAKDRVDDALRSAQSLKATDGRLAEQNREPADGGVETEPAKGLDTLPPVLKAVYAIRRGDVWTARDELEKDKEHLWHAGLLARTALSEEKRKREEDAVRKFNGIWEALTGESLNALPQATDTAPLLEKAIKDRPREDVLRLGLDLLQLREDFDKTRVVKEYAAVFKTVAAFPGMPTLRGKRLSGLGDGQVIQSEGNKYFVELHRGLQDNQDLAVGLCKDQTVYRAAGTNQVIGILADLYAVLPFQLLSEKQIMVALPAEQRKTAPVAGDCVLVDKEKNLPLGQRFIWRTPRIDPTVLFNSEPARTQKLPWKKAPGAVMNIDGGRLELTPDAGGQKEERRPDEGDLELPVEMGGNPLRLEFDLLKNPDQPFRIVMGSLEFLLADYEGRRAGIYAGSKLLKPIAPPQSVLLVAQRITILKSRTYTRLEMNPSSVDSMIPPAAGESEVKNILFFSNTRFTLLRFKVSRLWGTGEARIAGFSENRKEIVICRGVTPEWRSVAIDQPVWFFRSVPGDTNALARGRVKKLADPWLICGEVDRTKGTTNALDATSQAALSPSNPVPSSVEEIAGEPDLPRKAAAGPGILLAVLTPGTGPEVTLTLDTPGMVPNPGYLHPVLDRLTNPETGELLAVIPDEGALCEFKQNGLTVSCRLPEKLLSARTTNGMLIARNPLVGRRKVDLVSQNLSYVPGTILARKALWKALAGDWRETPGRLTGNPLRLGENPPVCSLTEPMGDGVQCDFEIKIEKETKPLDTALKNLMVELYFPGKEIGFTFSLGAETAGGIAVLGRTITYEKGALVLKGDNPPLENAVVRIAGKWAQYAPVIKTGRKYALRVRRCKEVLTFYVNGMRLAYVKCPAIDGNMQLRIATPDTSVSLGKVDVFELPHCLPASLEEPALGEFGYVLGADGSQLTIDADTPGIAPNRPVSVMAIDKVIQGEKSRTVFLRRVTTGTVTELGPRTAKVNSADPNPPVKRGMKVFSGVYPESFTFTDTKLQEIDQGR